jgi:hypothetical protein
MPTYRNDTGLPIYTTVKGGTVFLTVGQTYVTEYILSDPNLTLVSATPYYNPLIDYHRVVSSGPGDDKTVSISLDSKKVRLLKINAAEVDIYLQSLSNTPPIIQDWGENDPMIDIETDGKVSSMIIQFSASGNCYLAEYKAL